MRIYIIGNNGVALPREAPGALNEGEIAVASNEELHAAPLSGKQLLALWNALPGVEKRKKVGEIGLGRCLRRFTALLPTVLLFSPQRFITCSRLEAGAHNDG